MGNLPIIREYGRQLLFVAAVTAAFIAAVAPWPVVLIQPDDLSFYYASLFSAEGRPRVPWETLINLDRETEGDHYTSKRPGPPMQFVPTGDGLAATEKPPGYVWWLALLRRLGWADRANVAAFLITIPASFFLLRRLPDRRLAYWAVGIFLLSPMAAVYGYQPYIPTFLDTASLFLAFALYANVAAGGRGAIWKTGLLGAVLGFLCLTRVTHWPIAAAFALAIIVFKGQAGAKRWLLVGAFAAPLIAAAGAWAWYNNATFGSPWRSGYYYKVNADESVNGAAALKTSRRTIVPPTETALAPTTYLRAIPNGEMAAVGGVSRRAWKVRDDSYLVFRGTWAGLATVKAACAVAPPPWSRVAPKDSRVSLEVLAGGKRVYARDFGPGVLWRDVSFRYRATAGEDVRISFRFNDAGRRMVNCYLTPFDIRVGGERYLLSEEAATPTFAATIARNVIAIWPYILILLPGMLLVPFGWARARRALPGATFWLAVFTGAWTLAYYTQIRVYCFDNFTYMCRYHAPLLIPIALLGRYALPREGTGGKWATLITLAVFTCGVYLFVLAFAGVIQVPWLVPPGTDAFFAR